MAAEDYLGEELPEWLKIKESKHGIVYAEVPLEKYVEAAALLKERGYDRLLTIGGVDWIKKNSFEVYFLIYNHGKNLYLKVSTFLPRENPDIPSLSEIYPNAVNHERELCELFGITVNGKKLKPLFVEGWTGPPPFRKDFDWRQYVKEAYGLDK